MTSTIKNLLELPQFLVLPSSRTLESTLSVTHGYVYVYVYVYGPYSTCSVQIFLPSESKYFCLQCSNIFAFSVQIFLLQCPNIFAFSVQLFLPLVSKYFCLQCRNIFAFSVQIFLPSVSKYFCLQCLNIFSSVSKYFCL